MAKKIDDKTNVNGIEDTQISDNSADIFESDIDFWEDVMTEYGEINNRHELNLIIKKIETEAKRESAKINRKKKIVANRNKANIKRNKQRAKAEKRAYSALSPQKKAIYRQKKAEEAFRQKEQEYAAKQAEKEQKVLDAEKKRAQKAYDAEYRMHEKLAILAMTPQEKSEYLFQKNAKKRIDAAIAKRDAALNKQHDVSKSDILPVKGFVRFLFISMLVVAVLAFCGTNIYLDMGYYTEKIDELKIGISDYDIKLDGDMAVGVGDLESGLSVYNQILSNSPVMEEQLDKLNTTYFWTLQKESPASLGMDAVKVKAEELQKIINRINKVVEDNLGFSEDLDSAYNSDLSLLDLKESLIPYETKIESIANEFDSIPLPNGLEEHKEAFSKKIASNKEYYNTMISYLDELIVIRETLSEANATVASAEGLRPRSSTLDGKVDEYKKELSDIVDTEKLITKANNSTDYAVIIGKKDLSYVGNVIMSNEALSFYQNIMELRSIIDESNKVQRKCLDLPYPVVEKSKNDVILSHISQGTTDKALESNKLLEERIAVITVPSRIESSTRAYKTGLEIRTEFLELQKQYVDYEEEKSGKFVKYDEAKAAYDTAVTLANLERKTNGRSTDEYKRLYELIKTTLATMEEEEILAEEEADTIQELMKDVRVKAMARKEEYQDYMDYD